jgi:hypothetical protein
MERFARILGPTPQFMAMPQIWIISKHIAKAGEDVYVCPVCAYPRLPHPPVDFTICPSCGTEFGYHDSTRSYSELRFYWIENGMQWHSRVVRQPQDWNPVAELLEAGYLPAKGTSSSDISEVAKRKLKSEPVIEYSWA